MSPLRRWLRQERAREHWARTWEFRVAARHPERVAGYFMPYADLREPNADEKDRQERLALAMLTVDGRQ